jgi:hypothetical protein
MLIDPPVRLPPICNSAIKKDERMADACAGTTMGEIGNDREGKTGMTSNESGKNLE